MDETQAEVQQGMREEHEYTVKTLQMFEIGT